MLEAEKGRVIADAENRVLKERMREAGKKLSAADDKLRWDELHKQLLAKEVQRYKEDCKEMQRRMEMENKQLSSEFHELRLQEETARSRVQEVQGERVVLESRVTDLQTEVEREEEVTSLKQQLGDARKQQQSLEEKLKVFRKEMREKQER